MYLLVSVKTFCEYINLTHRKQGAFVKHSEVYQEKSRGGFSTAEHFSPQCVPYCTTKHEYPAKY